MLIGDDKLYVANPTAKSITMHKHATNNNIKGCHNNMSLGIDERMIGAVDGMNVWKPSMLTRVTKNGRERGTYSLSNLLNP